MAHEDIDTEVHEERFELGAPPKPPGRSAGFFLFWTGFLVAALGVALPLAHYFSLPDYQVGERLAELNIENGELIIGGLMLLAMGLVVRSAVRAARFGSSGTSSTRDDSDFLLVADQLATDVAQVLTSVMQISEEVTTLAQSHRDFLQRQSDDEANTDRQENALFRLAASLDKLNAHIDERVHGLDVQVRSHFDSIANAVHETRQLIEAHVTGGAMSHAPARAAASPQPQHEEPEFGDLAGEPPAIDFFESMDAGGPMPSTFGHAQGGDPEPPLPGQGQHAGGLDALLPDESIQRALDHDQYGR